MSAVPSPQDINKILEEQTARQNSSAMGHIGATAGLGLAGGGAIAAAAALYKRLLEKKEKPISPVIEVEQEPKLAAQTPAPTPPPSTVVKPDWETPAQYGAGAASMMGGYLLVRHFMEKQKQRELEAEKAQAEDEFSQAINQTLKPQGLSLKAASEKNDVDIAMEFIDKMANAAFPVEKKADFAGDSLSWLAKTIPWWLWGPAIGIPAGIGAVAGWNLSAKGNPARNELAMIARRNRLSAINAPTPVTAVVKKRKSNTKEDGEDTDNISANPATDSAMDPSASTASMEPTTR
jgi:hypothetical protein